MLSFIRTHSFSLIRLAGPVMMENLLLSILGIVDLFFIARLGLSQVAAAGVAVTILQIYLALFLALGTASSVLISRTIGEGKTESLKPLVAQSIYLAGGIGVVLGILSLLFAGPMVQLMGANGEASREAVRYFQIVASSSITIAIFTVLGSLLRGAGDTKSPFQAGLIMNGIHLVLDYVLIFGFLGFQGLGLSGAAIATVLARIVGIGLLGSVLYRKHRDLAPIQTKDWTWRYSLQRKIARLGFPAAMERLFKRSGQILYFGMMIRMGTLVFAAHRLAGNFTIVPDVIGTGFAAAASTFIGMELGKGNRERAKQYALTALLLTIVSMTGVLFFLYQNAHFGASLMTENRFVIQQITWVLGIDVIAQPATAAVLILTAALQAGGDMKFPMVTTGIGIWLFRSLGVYFFGLYLGWGLAGVWVSIALDNYFRAVILFMRYKKGKWIREIT